MFFALNPCNKPGSVIAIKFYAMRKSIFVLALITILGATVIYARPFSGRNEKNTKEAVNKKKDKKENAGSFKAGREKYLADKKAGASKQTLHADKKGLVQERIARAKDHEHNKHEKKDKKTSSVGAGEHAAQQSIGDQK